MAKEQPSRAKPLQQLRIAGLFAGVGGFELGLERAGHRPALLCEINPEARRVLQKRFPGVRLVGDVRKLRSLPRGIHLVTAGFPCQDLSQAGGAAGIAGHQSRLVWQVFRLIRKSKPEYVLLENVPFMLRLQRGRAVAQILERLESLGYKWAYRTVDARAFGIPQRRPRVFILASRQNDPRNILLADDAKYSRQRGRPSSVYGFYWTEGNTGIGLAVNAVPALKNGSGFGIPSPPAISSPNGHIVTPHLCDAERLQGFPPHWTAPAVNGSKTKHRWRLIGNAVNVRVATWLGRRLRQPGKYRDDDDAHLDKEQWPKAAYNVGKGCFEASVTEYPVARQNQSLTGFLRFPPKPLSKRAAEGILGRLQQSSLRAKSVLSTRLAQHLKILQS